MLVLLWFGSGIVMMYVGYPQLTEEERLAGIPPLEPSSIQLSASEALAQNKLPDEGVRELQLSSLAGRAVYQLRYENGRHYTLYADTGEAFTGHTPESAQALAQHFSGHTARYSEQLAVDQWTLSGSLDSWRPLHKVQLDDDAGTVLYISDVNGAVVRDTSRHERLWNWVGAVIHWVYPVQLRRQPEIWRQVVIVLSLVSLLLIATGSVVGLLRLRLKRPYKGGRNTPYRGIMRLHHILGLVCALFLGTYMFSGLMSMNPWQLFSAETSFSDQRLRYSGNAFAPELLQYSQQDSVNLLLQYPETRDIQWQRIANKGFLIGSARVDQRQVFGSGYRVPAGSGVTDRSAMALDIPQTAENAAAHLLPQHPIINVQTLTDYDSYYYSHRGRHRPLPILRLVFNDPEAHWFHIDIETGELLGRLTRRQRLQRWLYNGMHSLDFLFLIRHRPAWDLVVLFLCTLGLAFCGTAIVAAWRRLRR